ncbi:MAG: acetyltransferase, partial [Planctomycetia bacterium]
KVKKKVILFGLGDFSRIAFLYLQRSSEFEVVAFTVHSQFIQAPLFMDKPVVPFETVSNEFPVTDFRMFVAIGFKNLNKARSEIYHQCKSKGYELITYVSPHAFVFDQSCLGDNCFVFENNVIQPGVKIGNDVIIWSGNHIGHDATIGDHTFISSHVVVSGHVKIGERCFVGVNSAFKDSITIGNDCLIGAGSLILKDAADASVFKGTPAELSAVPSNRLRGI